MFKNSICRFNLLIFSLKRFQLTLTAGICPLFLLSLIMIEILKLIKNRIKALVAQKEFKRKAIKVVILQIQKLTILRKNKLFQKRKYSFRYFFNVKGEKVRVFKTFYPTTLST